MEKRRKISPDANDHCSMTFRPCRIERVHCLFSSTFKLNIHFLDAECVSIKCSMFLIKIFLIPSPFKDQILKIPADERKVGIKNIVLTNQ